MRLRPHRLLTKRMNPSVMKTVNAIELLELVRQHGPVSRARLAALSHLSKPTVSDQVDSLIAEGLVIEVGIGKASARGGKRPTLVQLNADYGRVLSVDVGPEWIRFASSDLVGKTIRRTERQTHPEQGARVVVGTIKRGLSDLLSRDGVGAARLHVISVGVPGSVDVRDGTVLETDNVFGWTGLRLGAALEKSYGFGVYIDNDVNMAALAEIRMEAGTAPRSFVLIRWSTGIGAAIVFGGDVHHGAHWAAGEVAHLVLDLNARNIAADRRGYLESIVGSDRVMERLHKASRMRSATISRRTFEEWACSTDPAISTVMEDVAAHLGTAIANISAVLDPAAIILLGDLFPPLLPRIQAVAARLVPWTIEIRLSRLGDDAALQGATVAGLSRAYEQISWTLQAGDDHNENFHAALHG